MLGREGKEGGSKGATLDPCAAKDPLRLAAAGATGAIIFLWGIDGGVPADGVLLEGLLSTADSGVQMSERRLLGGLSGGTFGRDTLSSQGFDIGGQESGNGADRLAVDPDMAKLVSIDIAP